MFCEGEIFALNVTFTGVTKELCMVSLANYDSSKPLKRLNLNLYITTNPIEYIKLVHNLRIAALRSCEQIVRTLFLRLSVDARLGC